MARPALALPVLGKSPVMVPEGAFTSQMTGGEGRTGPAAAAIGRMLRGLAMFEAKAAGLEEPRGAEAVRVPRVLAVGSDDDACLALEQIQLGTMS